MRHAVGSTSQEIESSKKRKSEGKGSPPEGNAKQARWDAEGLATLRPCEEPSSSNHVVREPQRNPELSVEDLKQNLRHKEDELKRAISTQDKLLKELSSSVECPVCYNVPRVAPVPCCSNGHVICQRCKAKLENCPTCRVRLTDCVSQIAATIIHRVSHTCEFRYEGCTFKSDIDKITDHESSCVFRHVRCPHWACDETITAKNLTHHVIASECGDNYRDKPLPYREEMEYARALDDEEGNGFWRPSLIQFDGITFYLQVEKSGKTKNWYFYVQMEGSAVDCKMYGVTIKVRKSLLSEGHSVVYNGDVCPIDIKGVGEVENSGGGLNIRNSIMENIFDVDALDRSDLEQQEEAGGDVEGERFRFWVEVDIFKSPKIGVKTEKVVKSEK